jgi:hypothetical protein
MPRKNARKLRVFFSTSGVTRERLHVRNPYKLERSYMNTPFALILGASMTLLPQMMVAQSDEYCIAIEKFAATIMRERQEETRSVGEQLAIVQGGVPIPNPRSLRAARL